MALLHKTTPGLDRPIVTFIGPIEAQWVTGQPWVRHGVDDLFDNPYRRVLDWSDRRPMPPYISFDASDAERDAEWADYRRRLAEWESRQGEAK